MRWLLATAILFSAWFLALTAEAQSTQCGERQEVLSRLSEKWHEQIIGQALASNGTVLEVLTTKSGSTYTIIMTRPNGTTCVMSTGQFWRQIAWKSQEIES